MRYQDTTVHGVTKVGLLLFAVGVCAASSLLFQSRITGAELMQMLQGTFSVTGAGFIIVHIRLPRICVAICCGALLALSGKTLQMAMQNPLASPDVLGINACAGAGLVVFHLFFPWLPAFVGAIGGSALGALIAYCVTGSGFSNTYKLIIAGIGLSFFATAIIQLVITFSIHDAGLQLAGYLVGSLNASNYMDVALGGTCLVIAVGHLIHLIYRAELLALGDELAHGLGAHPLRLKSRLIFASIIMNAFAVGCCGPIGFIALSAPHIASYLGAKGIAGIFFTALLGSFILLISDAFVMHIPFLKSLPTGMLTLLFGGWYLGYLLIKHKAEGAL